MNHIIAPIYPDLQPYMVMIMDTREIFSEKIRALLTCKKVRDLYDTYFLIIRGVQLDLNLVSIKLQYYGIEYDWKKLMARAAELKSDWGRELPALVKNLPNFEIVISTLDRFFISPEE